MATKTVEAVFSERRDFWIESIQIKEDQSLEDALKNKGFKEFIVVGIDPNDTTIIKDGMTLRIKILS